jgi:L-ascorbate metabolism protein UlaG (beta-lactamase superfamily)
LSSFDKNDKTERRDREFFMEISYLGHSSFKLKGKSVILVTDPFDPDMVGLKFPKIECYAVTVSHLHQDHDYLKNLEGTPLVISGPGEYEIKGTKIIGIASYHDRLEGKERGLNTIYRIEMDGISLVHLGDLGHKLDDRLKEVIDGVDVLMIPAGGFYTISPVEASEIISQLEPKVVIPMHFNRKELDQKNFGKLSDVSVLLREMGKENVKPIPKLVVSKDKLLTEMTVVVLE